MFRFRGQVLKRSYSVCVAASCGSTPVVSTHVLVMDVLPDQIEKAAAMTETLSRQVIEGKSAGSFLTLASLQLERLRFTRGMIVRQRT